MAGLKNRVAPERFFEQNLDTMDFLIHYMSMIYAILMDGQAAPGCNPGKTSRGGFEGRGFALSSQDAFRQSENRVYVL